MSEHMTPDAARQELNQLKSTRTDIPPVTHVALTALAFDTVQYQLQWKHANEWDDNGNWFHIDNEKDLQDILNTLQPRERLIARRVSPHWTVPGAPRQGRYAVIPRPWGWTVCAAEGVTRDVDGRMACTYGVGFPTWEYAMQYANHLAHTGATR